MGTSTSTGERTREGVGAGNLVGGELLPLLGRHLVRQYSRWDGVSRFYDSEKGVVHYGMWIRESIPYFVGDTYFDVTAAYEYRLDKIAYEVYDRNTDLMWVIAVANSDRIIDPIQDVKVGVRLRIPPLIDVIEYLDL